MVLKLSKLSLIALAFVIMLAWQGSQKATSAVYVVRKTSQQQVTSSTTFVGDTDLFYSVKANTNYVFRLEVPFETGGIISGYKFQIVAPTSPTAFVSSTSVYNGASGALATSIVSASASVPIAGTLAAAGSHYFSASGTIENGANDGSIQLQFAQNVSNASPIIVSRGATLTVYEVR